MPLIARFMMFDCGDSRALADFWSAALSAPVEPFSGARAIKVPLDSTLTAVFAGHFPSALPAAHRLHIEFTVSSGTLTDEVARLELLGAHLIDDQRRPDMDGVGWVIMTDPEGNEFRVQSNDEETDRLETRLQAAFFADPPSVELD